MFTLSILFSSLGALVVVLLLAPRWRLRGGLLFVVGAVATHLAWWASMGDYRASSAAVPARLLATIWSVGTLATVVLGVPTLLGRGVAWLVARGRSARPPAAAPASENESRSESEEGRLPRQTEEASADAPGAASASQRPEAPMDPARRRFLGGAAVPLLGLGTGASGTIRSISGFEILQHEIPIPGLPAALDGFRIGQITDVHVGTFIDVEYLREAVDAMNDAGVDLQVMTGDLIDDLGELDATMDALDSCRARHGMLAVIGNHEIWRGEEEVRAAYARSAARGGVRLLVDESVRLDHGGAPLRVVGVDYPMIRGVRFRLQQEQRRRLMEASAARAFAGVAPDETVLCLTHHPDFFRIAAARGAHLTLAGHTHGGQVAFFGIPLFRPAYEFMLGGYRLGDAFCYVSGGTGHWFPWRLGVPPEVTILTLRSAPSRPRPEAARA